MGPKTQTRSIWSHSRNASHRNDAIAGRSPGGRPLRRRREMVHVVPMGTANAFMIEGDDGLTLIEAGFPGKEAAVFGAIRGLGRSPDQLKQPDFHSRPP